MFRSETRIPPRAAVRPRKWPPEVRARVVSLAADPAWTITAISRALGVPFSTAQGWIAEAISLQSAGDPPVGGKGPASGKAGDSADPDGELERPDHTPNEAGEVGAGGAALDADRAAALLRAGLGVIALPAYADELPRIRGSVVCGELSEWCGGLVHGPRDRIEAARARFLPAVEGRAVEGREGG